MSKYFGMILAIALVLGGFTPAFAQTEVVLAPSHTIDILDLKDMDTVDVLRLISQKSGINIVADSHVSGKVTIYLKDIDAREALRIICESNDLAFLEEDNFIRIMTAGDYEKRYGREFHDQTIKKIIKLRHVSVKEALPALEKLRTPNGLIIPDERTNTLVLIDIPHNMVQMQSVIQAVDVKRTTEVFDLTYAGAEELAEKITPILTPNVGSLRFDIRSNKISVTDLPAKIWEVYRIMQAFDVKQKQVAIEAKIVQVILSDRYRMGIDWEALMRDYHGLNFVGNFDVLGVADKKGAVSIGNLARDNYQVMIEALSEFGQTNNLSSPHIITVDREEAKILVGSTEPYVTTTTTTPASGPTTIAEAVNFIEVGVKLYVTPVIHKDGYVTMKIRPEVSSVTRTITTSNNNTIPVIETSEAETTVTVKNGVTIMIGGLIKDEKINSDKKIPLLGDVPVAGALFRSKDHAKRKTELVIFLTPRIISGDAPQLRAKRK